MSGASQKQWYVLKLASIAISKNRAALDQLSQRLVSHYSDSEIAGLWRQARLLLKEGDQGWLENELYQILVLKRRESAA